MSDSFSSLTKELKKSRSLVLAGKSAMGSSGRETAAIISYPSFGDSRELGNASVAAVTNIQSVSVTSALDNEIESKAIPDVPALDSNQGELIAVEQSTGGDVLSTILHEKDPGMTNLQPEPILIYSVGTVRQRYRIVKRKEEEREAQKMTRLKRTTQVKPAPDGLAMESPTDKLEAVAPPQSQYDVIVDNIKYSTVSTCYYAKSSAALIIILQLCTDLSYKKSVTDIVKECRRSNKKLLLITVVAETEDDKRDCRQVLKLIYMTTAAPSMFSCVPAIIETVDMRYQMEL